MARYKILIKPSAVKEVESVGQKNDRQRIIKCIQGLADEPRPVGAEKLAGRQHEYRIRQGDFRVIFSVDDKAWLVHVIKVGHRREVYR